MLDSLPNTSTTLRRAFRSLVPLLSLLLVIGPASAGAREDPPEDWVDDGAETGSLPQVEVESLPESDDNVFSVDSPIGPIAYRAGRGLHFSSLGLNIGGFGTLEFDREEGSPGELAFDGLNFLILYEPIEYFHAFAELEVGDLFQVETNSDDLHSDPTFNVERLYGDFSLHDPFNLRVGKFQTPVGRWNLVPAEPFIWTASDPAVFERAFDEHQTGAAFFGSVYPGSNALRYWVYGQFIDPLDPDSDPKPADRSVGGRVELGDSSEVWSLGASFLSAERDGDWSYLGGLDGQLQLGGLELTSEFVYQRGDIRERRIWDIYVQAVYEVLPGFHLVGRYERFDPSGSSEDADIFDLGVAWIPLHYLILKADYRLSDHQNEQVRRGLSMSFSVLF